MHSPHCEQEPLRVKAINSFLFSYQLHWTTALRSMGSKLLYVTLQLAQIDDTRPCSLHAVMFPGFCGDSLNLGCDFYTMLLPKHSSMSVIVTSAIFSVSHQVKEVLCICWQSLTLLQTSTLHTLLLLLLTSTVPLFLPCSMRSIIVTCMNYYYTTHMHECVSG